MARVLVVDDDVLQRELLFEILHGAGHHVTTAVDGSDALHLLDLGHDLVVLDLQTPQVDGYGVLSHIRSSTRFAQTPVIVVSGMATGDWATGGRRSLPVEAHRCRRIRAHR
jgi:CheY-like chemotaxis protein